MLLLTAIDSLKRGNMHRKLISVSISDRYIAISIQKMKRALLNGGLNEDFIKQMTPALHLPKCPSADMKGLFQAVRMLRQMAFPRDTSSTLSTSE